MMRALGFLSGVCLTVAALLLMVNNRNSQQPQPVTQTSREPTAQQISEVVATIAEQVDVLPAETESDLAIPPLPESGAAVDEPQNGFGVAMLDPDQQPEEQVESDQTRATEPEATTAPDQTRQQLEDSAPDQGPEMQVQATDSDPEASALAGSHMFWSPFRSVWAARGFAGRLTTATQVPVEVVHVGPGQYRVAFDYRDETDRLTQIERIESITGLELE